MFKRDNSVRPPICLPQSVDTTRMIDITVHGDRFRRYIDPATGKVYDGAYFHQLATYAEAHRVSGRSVNLGGRK